MSVTRAQESAAGGDRLGTQSAVEAVKARSIQVVVHVVKPNDYADFYAANTAELLGRTVTVRRTVDRCCAGA